MSGLQLRRFNTMYCGDGVAVAECDSLCIVIWRGEVTRERFEKQRRGVEHVVSQGALAGSGLLCVVESHVKPPNDELRAASVELACSSGIKCVACVIEARGFAGALTRSVLVGMKILAGKRPANEGFFASVAEASEWLSPQVGFTIQDINVGAAALRAQLERTSPTASLSQLR